ncbi:hypothetical protein ACS0TY_022554 [Phlomoides rotata]
MVKLPICPLVNRDERYPQIPCPKIATWVPPSPSAKNIVPHQVFAATDCFTRGRNATDTRTLSSVVRLLVVYFFCLVVEMCCCRYVQHTNVIGIFCDLGVPATASRICNKSVYFLKKVLNHFDIATRIFPDLYQLAGVVDGWNDHYAPTAEGLPPSSARRNPSGVRKLITIVSVAVQSRDTMRTVARQGVRSYSIMNRLIQNTLVIVAIGIILLTKIKQRRDRNDRRRKFTILDRIPSQMRNMSYLCEVSDEDCKDQLRMDRAAFHKLCFILRVSVPEKVAMFLSILAHHTKNRCVKFAFKPSGQTVSKHFHAVLNSVLRLHAIFLVKPQPITEDETNPRWQSFQGCLRALDRTYIDVHVPITEKGRYRIRKGQVSVNVLGVCDKNMRFLYVLTWWEGLPRIHNGLCDQTYGTEWREDEDCSWASGWKSDNGFKAGFLRELEKGMRKIIPTTDLMATPHINSKIHVWKKGYGALSDLLNKSGIGWNSTTSMIEIEDEGIWVSCKRADPHVKGLRYKTCPYYPQWIDIFGKDRAAGEHAVDPIDIINNLYKCGMDQEGDPT